MKNLETKEQSIKCVVWDLDNTIWSGILLEDEAVVLRDGIKAVLKELDRRGLLNSISSRNDYDSAIKKLAELGLDEYFLYPQINWNSKAESIEAISRSLNFGLDTFAFVDDQPFEREEVSFFHPEVLCIDAADLHNVLGMRRMMPRFVTPESHLRRKMYLSDMKRSAAESDYKGSNNEFLATLNMVFKIKIAEETDLQRAEELTLRTHQLNSTGRTFTYDQLNELRESRDHLLLVASLEDKYDTYGTIGLSLVEFSDTYWIVKLLLFSCRVLSRGVTPILMSYIMSRAKDSRKWLRAEFTHTEKNRIMYVSFKFSGFEEIEKYGESIIFENDLRNIAPYPNYVDVRIQE